MTLKIKEHLDNHLTLPLLEFFYVRQLYDGQELLEEHLRMLSDTKMVDYSLEIHAKLHGGQGDTGTRGVEHLLAKRREIVEELRHHLRQVGNVYLIFGNLDVQERLSNNLGYPEFKDYLTTKYNYRQEMTEKLYNFGLFQFECGQYHGASQSFYLFRRLVPTTHADYLSTSWRKYSAEILTQHWTIAVDELVRLRNYIDGNNIDNGNMDPAFQEAERVKLLHRSNFIWFNYRLGKDVILDLYLRHPPYLPTSLSHCPYLLRYFAVAVVLSPQQRPHAMERLMQAVQNDQYTCVDPITELLKDIYVRHDYETARERLARECELALTIDFFLSTYVNAFMDNASAIIVEARRATSLAVSRKRKFDATLDQ